MYKIELPIDAVKALIFKAYNQNVDIKHQLLDKDFEICYNSSTRTVILENNAHDKTRNKEYSIQSSANRIYETD